MVLYVVKAPIKITHYCSNTLEENTVICHVQSVHNKNIWCKCKFVYMKSGYFYFLKDLISIATLQGSSKGSFRFIGQTTYIYLKITSLKKSLATGAAYFEEAWVLNKGFW